MKKSGFLLIMAFLLLVGCSSNNSDSSDAAATKETGSSDDPIEITYIGTSDKGPEEPILEAIEKFEEENPDIKVTYEVYPFRELFEKLEVLLSSESTDIDVIDVDGPLVSNYSAKGYLEPLEPMLPEGTVDEWVDELTTAYSYDGQLVAAPTFNSSQVLFYNKDIFEEKNIDFPSSDMEDRMTWEETIDIAKELTYNKDGEDIFGLSMQQVSRPYQTMSLAYALGAQPMDDDGLISSGYSNSPEMIEAAQFFYDLYNTWEVSPKIPTDQTIDYFTSGKNAMFLASGRLTNVFAEAGVNFGVAPHPYFEGKEAVTPTGAWSLGISKFSPNKEAALKFIEYMTLGEGVDIWLEETQHIPATISGIEAILENSDSDDIHELALMIGSIESKETAVARPASPGYLEWESEMDKAFEDIKNGKDPKEALDKAVEIIDNRIQKYAELYE